MFVLLILASSYKLPDKAKDVRSGIFKWADALGGQRAFLKGVKMNFGGTQVRFDNKKIDARAIGRGLMPQMVGFNLSDTLKGALESFTGGGNSNSGSSSESGGGGGGGLRLLAGSASGEGCASLAANSIEYQLCTNFGLDNYTGDEYWGMPMGDAIASIIGYVAVVIVLAVFFALSILLYIIFCWGCCCCCCPQHHRSAGLCNLITMVLSSTLIVVAAIFYMCGWLGISRCWSMYKTYDQEDGIVVQVLDGLSVTVKTGFDKDTGFGSVLLPIVGKTRTDIESDIGRLTELIQSLLDIGNQLTAVFNDIYKTVDPDGKPEDPDPGIVPLVEKNNEMLKQENQKIDTKPIKDQMTNINDEIKKMDDQLKDLESQVKTIPDMINSSVSPGLSQAEEYLSDPIGKLMGGKDISQTLEDLKKDVLSNQGWSADLKKYDKVAQNAYNILTGLYMIFGVLLFGIVAIWLTAFFTYSSCSRCVVNCACCCPCFCTWCCLITGLIGSVTCVLTFYVMTWGVEFGDGAVQGIYASSIGEELVIPEINMSGLSNGMITEPLKIPPIKMANPSDVNLLDAFLTADASKVTDIVTWLNLEQILPLAELASSIKQAIYDLMKSVNLPADVQSMLDDASEQLKNVSISKDSVFQDVNSTIVEELKNQADSIVNNGKAEEFKANCDKIIDKLKPLEVDNSPIDQVNGIKNSLAEKLPGFGTEALDDIKLMVNNSFGNIMDIVGNIMPALKKVDAKVCVQSVNAVLEVSLWTMAQLFVCWSISAHLLMFAMFVSVIMLWVRRRGMKPADEASDSSSDEESETKDGAAPVSSRQRQSLGSAGTHDVSSSSSSNSSNTIEYKSKAFKPQGSDSSSSNSDNDWNGHNNGGDTFVF